MACDAQTVIEGYDTRAVAVGRLRLDRFASRRDQRPGDPSMLLATSAAVSKDIGLLATFLGIGLIVNAIVVFIAVLIRGERRQNRQRR
jgi:hypothetical protein